MEDVSLKCLQVLLLHQSVMASAFSFHKNVVRTMADREIGGKGLIEMSGK